MLVIIDTYLYFIRITQYQEKHLLFNTVCSLPEQTNLSSYIMSSNVNMNVQLLLLLLQIISLPFLMLQRVCASYHYTLTCWQCFQINH